MLNAIFFTQCESSTSLLLLLYLKEKAKKQLGGSSYAHSLQPTIYSPQFTVLGFSHCPQFDRPITAQTSATTGQLGYTLTTYWR